MHELMLSNTNRFEDCPECWKNFIKSLNIPHDVSHTVRREIVHKQLACYGGRVIANRYDEWTSVEFESAHDFVQWLISYE